MTSNLNLDITKLLNGSAKDKKTIAKSLLKNATSEQESLIVEALQIAFPDPKSWELQCDLILILIKIRCGRDSLVSLSKQKTTSTIVYIYIGYALAQLYHFNANWMSSCFQINQEFSEGVIKAVSENKPDLDLHLKELILQQEQCLPINGERGTWTRVYIANCCGEWKHPPAISFLNKHLNSSIKALQSACQLNLSKCK